MPPSNYAKKPSKKKDSLDTMIKKAMKKNPPGKKQEVVKYKKPEKKKDSLDTMVKKSVKKLQKKDDSPFDDIKKGALSKALGIPEKDDIPKSILKKIMKANIMESVMVRGKGVRVTRLLKKRAQWALNFAK